MDFIYGNVYNPDGLDLEEIRDKISELCVEIMGLLGPDREFSGAYAGLNFNARARKNVLENIVVPLEEYFGEFREDGLDIQSLSDLMDRIDGVTSSGRRGLDCLIPEKWNKGGPNLKVCPNLPALKERLEGLRNRLNSLSYIK